MLFKVRLQTDWVIRRRLAAVTASIGLGIVRLSADSSLMGYIGLQLNLCDAGNRCTVRCSMSISRAESIDLQLQRVTGNKAAGNGLPSGASGMELRDSMNCSQTTQNSASIFPEHREYCLRNLCF